VISRDATPTKNVIEVNANETVHIPMKFQSFK
jgi:hypothetical protein